MAAEVKLLLFHQLISAATVVMPAVTQLFHSLALNGQHRFAQSAQHLIGQGKQ